MRLLRSVYLFAFLTVSTLVFSQVGFVENLGQWDGRVQYRVDYQTHTIYVDQQGFSLLLHDTEKWADWVEQYHGENRDDKNKVWADSILHMQHIGFQFSGADMSRPIGQRTCSGYYNYFVGNDQSKWVHGAKKHEVLLFKSVYPNIDLEIVAADKRFKYNFILGPGANLNDIRLNIKGSNGITVSDQSITIATDFGEVTEVMPIAYTTSSTGERQRIAMRYVEHANGIGFEGEVSQIKQLTVVDPELIFSTYSGSTSDNFGFTATYDKEGNLYAGGIVATPAGSLKYPVTVGAYDVTFNGGTGRVPANLDCDISISKYDSTGSQLVYATYLGGRDDEYPHSLVVDDQGSLIVFGTTYSGNYPTHFTAPYLGNNGLTDIVVTKFTPDGSNIVGSTYIGGNGYDGLNRNSATRYYYADDFRGEVNIDAQGRIYVAASTFSTNFPVKLGNFQTNFAGEQDGVVFCLSADLNLLLWSSYLGGSKTDALYSVDIADNGEVYVSGGTSSTDLKSTAGAVQASNRGGRADGFIAKISNNGKSLDRVTYWGTSKYDQVLSLDIDRFGSIFVVGHTDGDMPVTSNILYSNDGGKQFITKFTPALDEMKLSTVYGSGKSLPDITVNAFLVDECGKIFVSGWGGNINSGSSQKLAAMPLTPDALQSTTDGNDFHLAVFRRDALELLYATYFGGNLTQDHVDGGTSRFDKKGVIYQSVCSSCPPSSDGQTSRVSDFPTTPGAFSENNPSIRCSNASFKLAFGNLNRRPELNTVEYRVRALDTLRFTYRISDPDQDTFTADFLYGANDINAFISRPQSIEAFEQWSTQFVVNPLCEHVGDTLRIKVYALDRGCPAPKDSTAEIMIIVEPPPPIDPPSVLCLNFVDSDGLRIEWEGIPSSRYFRQMYLYKISPNNDTSVLDTLYTTGAGSFTDRVSQNPREANYTYFLRVENLCGELGTKSYDLSSVKEHEIPVESTYLKTVTVEGSTLRISWLSSKEDDFGHYELYKGKRGDTKLTYVTSIAGLNDTFFIDEEVAVGEQSYCYQIRVSDDCGHLSAYSNMGCSIVIRGESQDDGPKVDPRFSFDLRWDDYIYWDGGVDYYQLVRSVDTGSLRPLVAVNHPTLDYTDSDLDFDWGGYWFSVVAFEGPGSQQATSRSNDIYLIQPPLVFVPNAFTSDGDGLNEVFGWSDVFVRDFSMRVYNRWGEKVFETTDKNATWSGEYLDGGLNNSTVFIWIVEYKGWDNYRHIKKGTVTMIR